MSRIRFDRTHGPLTSEPMAWEVSRRKRVPQAVDQLGTIEWHQRLGAYGFAAAFGKSFLQGDEVMAEIAAFLDELNAG